MLRRRALSAWLTWAAMSVVLAPPGVAARPGPGRADGAARLEARWVEPAAGARWTAGEAALLAWEPAGGFEALTHIEEWEAFLSFDGGATFTVRLTPHLDFARRQVRVRVPEIASPRAQLMLRVGDEVVEHEVATRVELEIVPARRPSPGIDRRLAWRFGEAARAGSKPTFLWSEGDRQGGRWIERASALPRQVEMGPTTRPGAPLFALAAAGGERTVALLAPATGAAAPAREVATERAAPAARRTLSILLLTARRNE